MLSYFITINRFTAARKEGKNILNNNIRCNPTISRIAVRLMAIIIFASSGWHVCDDAVEKKRVRHRKTDAEKRN